MILRQVHAAKLFAADQAMFEPHGNICQGSELIAYIRFKMVWMKPGGDGVLKDYGFGTGGVFGEGCPIGKDKKFYRIHDADGFNLMLITKMETKRLDFYAPNVYENQCPGRKGRVAIIKITTLFTAQTKLQMD